MDIAGIPINEAVRLHLQLGDILVFRVGGRMEPDVREHATEFMRRILPEGVKFLLLDGDVDISVITPPVS